MNTTWLRSRELPHLGSFIVLKKGKVAWLLFRNGGAVFRSAQWLRRHCHAFEPVNASSQVR
ncbi:hypothetical protein ACQE32_11830 [Pantoea sp. FN0302]|uniref:hypothetical protein n=1 Tax=Pantoea TaxID=53335 RepID=UPI00202B8BEE|nr:hypothetical protein [Pantoea alhagi]URQ60963.1 hypothetical protein LQ939_00845 [Pantoea alhagi]